MFRKTKELEQKVKRQNKKIMEQNGQITVLTEFYKNIGNIAREQHYNSADNLMNKIKSAVDNCTKGLHF